MKKVYWVICILLISVSSFAGEPTTTDYWLKIKRIASKEFGGLELNPVLKTGYQFTGDYEGPGIGIQMDLPLWSKKRRLEKREQAVKFLQTGAELVQKLETAINTLELLQEKSRFLKAIMRDEGVESVEAFFRAEKEIIEQKALETQYRRELDSLINPLSMNDSDSIKIQPANLKDKESLDLHPVNLTNE